MTSFPYSLLLPPRRLQRTQRRRERGLAGYRDPPQLQAQTPSGRLALQVRPGSRRSLQLQPILKAAFKTGDAEVEIAGAVL
jgi:hypothetical protein